MASDLFWCRRIRLEVGSNQPPFDGLRIGTSPDADGAEFRIDFNIKKTRSSSANKSIIEIYNLSRESRDKLDKEYDRVTLEAGYQGVTPIGEQGFWGIIFDGWIDKVTHVKRSSGDIVTSLQCIDGGVDWANSRINKTYASGRSYRDVAADIISNMKLVKIGDISGIPVDSLVSEGRAHNFTTTCRKALDVICRNHDCRWTINNNVVEIVKNNSGIKDSQTIPVISENTGMIGSPSKTEKGITVRSLLHPKLEPNRFIYVIDNLIGSGRFNRNAISANLESQSAIEGDKAIYRINDMSFMGSNYSNEFYCDMNCQASDGFTVKRPQVDYSPTSRIINKG